ncbi:SDR family oxidoreductase [Paenibacillus elgii]
MDLQGKVAVVAGATRGAGRAIAVTLGEVGATVYCTGRSVRGQNSDLGRTETIEETAEMVTQAGGLGIAVQVDHTEEEQVRALFARIEAEQDGRLDILINDVWGGDMLTEWPLKFWEASLEKGRLLLERAVWSHILTSRYGVPLMVNRGAGIVIEVTDGENYQYRGNLFYSLAKTAGVHLAEGMAADFASRGLPITAVAVTPGFLRSEVMLDLFGVTEENWREGAAKDPHFIASETPYYVARAIRALICDPDVGRFAGQTLSSWGLSEVYDFVDLDGRRPHWGRYFRTI